MISYCNFHGIKFGQDKVIVNYNFSKLKKQYLRTNYLCLFRVPRRSHRPLSRGVLVPPGRRWWLGAVRRRVPLRKGAFHTCVEENIFLIFFIKRGFFKTLSRLILISNRRTRLKWCASTCPWHARTSTVQRARL